MKSLHSIISTFLFLAILFAADSIVFAQCSAGSPAGAALIVGPTSEYAYRYQNGAGTLTNLGIVFCAEDQEYQFKRVTGENEFSINPILGTSAFTGNLTVKNNMHVVGQVYFGPNKRIIPDYSFVFEGNVLAERITLEFESNWPDFVFMPDYELRSLPELEKYIRLNGHLPHFPAASEVESTGMDIAEVQAALLQTLEEYSLHLIEADKKLQETMARLAEVEAELAALKANE